MAIFRTNPMDVLALDADVDLAWDTPRIEEGESAGNGRLYKATFDDGRVIIAIPFTGGKRFSLIETDSERGGYIDVHRIPKKDLWTIFVRVQSGPYQSFVYPREAWVRKNSEFNPVSTRDAVSSSRREAIVLGMGVYHAVTRQMAIDQVFVENHRPIVRVIRTDATS